MHWQARFGLPASEILVDKYLCAMRDTPLMQVLSVCCDPPLMQWRSLALVHPLYVVHLGVRVSYVIHLTSLVCGTRRGTLVLVCDTYGRVS